MCALGENASNAVLPGPLPLSIEDDGDYAGVRVGYLNGPFNVAIVDRAAPPTPSATCASRTSARPTSSLR